LELAAFGPFTGTRIELPSTPGVVDLVYGTNEAGKSTTLRAITGLLFGIPEKTTDAHRHARADLRIGGVLESADGRRLEVVRRKGRKDTLLDRDGRPMDEGVLAALLGGMTAEVFVSMFGLDHDGLRASAEAMLAGKGHVGESLFAAGVGARGLHALRERLAAEADELYTARGRDKKVLVRAIADVREARRAVEDASTSARGYLEQKRGLEEARARAEQLRERKAALGVEQARLNRVLQLLPEFAQRARLEEKLGSLGAVVALPEDASEQRLSAVQRLDEAQRKRHRLSDEIAHLEKRAAELVVPESLVTVDPAAIRGLEELAARYLGAQKDLPKRTTELQAIEAAIERSLATIDPGLRRGDVERLRLGVSQVARIRKLAAERAALDAELGRLGRDVAALAAKRDHLATRLSSSLGLRGDEAKRALERPAALPVPAPDVVAVHADAARALAAERKELGESAARLSARKRDVAKDIDALQRAGSVPTEDDLRAARGERDAIWQRLRAGAVPDATVLDELGRAVARADEIGDRLRREADRVARLAALSADREALADALRDNAARLTDVEARDVARAERWAELWAAAGLLPRAPEEMRAFCEGFQKLLELDGDGARLTAELGARSADLDKWQTRWSDVVRSIGLTPSCSPDEALAVVEKTAELLARVEQAEDLRRRIDAMGRDSRLFTEEVVALCRAHLPEAAALPPAEAARRFVRAFEQARRDEDERRRTNAELTEKRKALAVLESVEREAGERVARLLAAAGAADIAELEAAEKRSATARELTLELARVERRILELGDGAPIDALGEEVRGIDVDRARTRYGELADEIDRVTEEWADVVRQIAQWEAGIRHLADGTAADAAAELAQRSARLTRHVQRYVRVRLASVLLDREIERYRQANQGPIVERASELFPRLTLGRYTGLRVGFGADDEAVLLPVRRDGAAVPVDALSDGTRDALYLSLRLASLERHAARNEPMPLVLDDVLIQLDDERARAALEVMGDVAKTTQVLFFTHHARLVDLARSALGADRLAEHVLPAASVRDAEALAG
jgi:uncharacterized protein YhaN